MEPECYYFAPDDIDDTIDVLIADTKKEETKAGSDDESEVDEELEKDLQEHLIKRRRGEKTNKREMLGDSAIRIGKIS